MCNWKKSMYLLIGISMTNLCSMHVVSYHLAFKYHLFEDYLLNGKMVIIC